MTELNQKGEAARVRTAVAIALGLAGSFGMAEGYAATTNLTCSGSTTTLSDGITDDSKLIQNAINAATAGDTIVIAAGTCEISRPITINKALTLQGAKAGVAPGASGWDSGVTKLHGFYNAQYGVSTFTVVVSASDVTVSGFEFGDNGHSAIDLEGTISNITISNNYIRSSQMWGGIILGNTAGVFTNVTIDANTIVATGTKNGSNASGLVRFGSKVSPNMKVRNNIFQQAPIGGFVLFGWAATDSLEFSGNTIKGGLVNVAKVTNGTMADNRFEGGALGTTYGDGIYTIMSGGTISGNAFRNGAYLQFGPSTQQVTPPTFVSANVTVSGNDLTGSGNVLVGYHEDAATIDVNNNSLVRTGAGFTVVNTSPTGTLDATNNYWGTSVAADIAAKVSGTVTYSPFKGFAPVEIEEVAAGSGQLQEFTGLQSPVAMTFDTVVSGGSTTVTAVASGDPGYVAPSGFSLGSPPVYLDIKTTATFSGAIEVCVTYPANSVPANASPKLYHYENSAWADVTTSVDTVNRKLCGSVSSLSPFAMGYVPTAVTSYGFFHPVDMGIVNIAKAGQAIPLKFRLSADPLSSTLRVTVTAGLYDCASDGSTLTDVIEQYTTGASGLQYLGNGYWQWNWKTDKTFAGKCRKVVLTPAADGYAFSPATIEARFRFTK